MVEKKTKSKSGVEIGDEVDSVLAAAPGPVPEPPKPWCVDVDLEPPLADFTLRFDTELAAGNAVAQYHEQGYVERDVKKVTSDKYDTFVYPIERVRSFKIWKDESVAPS